MGQEPTFLLYAATVTSSIRPIEGSRCSARMLVGKLQGRPTAAREPRLLASLIGRIISADGRIEGGPVATVLLLPRMCHEGFENLFISLFESE